MSHVTHVDESCYTYQWIMSHTWMSDSAPSRSCIHKQVTLHISLSQVSLPLPLSLSAASSSCAHEGSCSVCCSVLKCVLQCVAVCVAGMHDELYLDLSRGSLSGFLMRSTATHHYTAHWVGQHSLQHTCRTHKSCRTHDWDRGCMMTYLLLIS